LGGGGIASSEQIEVVEFMVKVVENLSGFETWMKGEFFFIRLVKGRTESSKHVGESNICFAVTIVTGRIKNKWVSRKVLTGISSPEVSMKQGRVRCVTLKEKFEVEQKSLGFIKGATFACSQLKLMLQTMLLVELNPVVTPGVWLRS
jgi:hypothetical protein